jgi:tetratricopeptide (TPR) repeat protein
VDADLDVLQSLVDKSLLQHSGGRFEYLQTIREYALERLAESGEAAELRNRHATWFVDLVRTAQLNLQTADQETWFELLRAESDNIRAVLRHALTTTVPDVFELANALVSPWRGPGLLPDLVEWYRAALPRTEALDSATRAATLEAFGSALVYCNQLEEAAVRLEASLRTYREIGDELGEAAALNALGNLSWIRGEPEDAISRRTVALGIYRSRDHRRGVARSLHLLGEDLRDAGRDDEAVAALEESIAINRELGNGHSAMMSIHSLGDLWLGRRDAEQARSQFRAALSIAHRLSDELSVAYCLAGLSCTAALDLDPFTAGRLWGAAEAIEHRLGQAMLGKERARYQQMLAAFDGDVLYAAAVEDGRRAPTAQLTRQWL